MAREHSRLGQDVLELPKSAGSSAAIPAVDRKEFEREEARRILAALGENRWNVSEVSRIMGIPRNTLYRKLTRYKIKRPKEG